MYVSYDPAVQATYVKLTEADVVETVEVSDLVMVDVDAHHEPVGVEFLALPNRVSHEMLAQVADAFPGLKVLMETESWLLPVIQPV
jgi:uncharacterized protein YuzE